MWFVLMVRARRSSHVDPAAGIVKKSKHHSQSMELHRQQKHKRYEIPFDEQFLLHPGSLALVPTLEWLKLPSDVLGTVTARSTWAREGLSIATATLATGRRPCRVTRQTAVCTKNSNPNVVVMKPAKDRA